MHTHAMNSSTVYLTGPSDPSAWQQALYAFLAEKHRRSGSMRTVQSYSRMLQDFFGRAHRMPDEVTSPDVLSWAHGRGLSDREPGAITIGARIACVSSFYKFLIRMGTLASNPCDALERPKIQPSLARGYTADDVRKVLAVVPDTVPGRRDRAIILTLVLTGRRRSEVINLKAGNITTEGERAFYTYRGKGGKTGRRELPQPVYQTLLCASAACTRRPGVRPLPHTLDPDVEDRPDHIALQRAERFFPGASLAHSTVEVGACLARVARLGKHDAVEDCIQPTIAPTIETVPDAFG
jgi:hypothetical protein